MNLEMLRKSDYIVYEVISGSHMYGTNTPTSDQDIRGIFSLPLNDYIGLSEPPGQISDEKHDIVFYSLKRIFELLLTANPNIIELLYPPKDCVIKMTPVMEKLIANRKLFITKKAYHTHTGYAHAQIEKATGQNKLINNPMPEEKPKKEDYCWIISRDQFASENLLDGFPARPIPLNDTNIDLKHYHVSALEHVPNTYRLYFYGDKAKGVFRGDSMLTCESIPKEDEKEKFFGLLIYVENEWTKALKKWKEYWDWVKIRNSARWIDQEKGMLNYDAKNLCHCMRLLLSGENILKNGEPIVRFEGDMLKYLKDIRSGKFSYEEIMAEVDKRMNELKKIHEESTLPWGVDQNEAEKLYRELSLNH